MRRLILFLIISLVLTSSNIAYAYGDYAIVLRAHPQAIVADSQSATTISAEVTDANGDRVPDGTEVEFSTSLGIIERRARTTSGVARVRLQSETTTGTALVSAVVVNGNAVAQLRVDFLEPGAEMLDESFISVESDTHLGYDVGAKIVDAAGGVRIYHRGVTIDAYEAQIDVSRNILRAKARMGGENIIIKRGDKTIHASALYYDFGSMRGVLISPVEDGAKRYSFRGRDFHMETDVEADDSITFDYEPITESKMFIKAQSLFIRPGEEVKIRRAKFYMEGDKLLSVPLYVVPLSGSGGGTGQFFTYGTDGLRLDFPIYYSLTPQGTGAVRIRHSEPTSWGYYGGRSGWQVDVEQQYNFGGSTEGVITANKVTSKEWGLSWTQRRDFGDAQIYSFIDFPAHRDLYGTLDYYRRMQGYTMSLNLRGNKVDRLDGRYSASAYMQSHTKPLINNIVDYSFTTRLNYNSLANDGNNKLGTGIGLQLYGKPINLGGGSNLNTSLSVNQGWGGSSEGTSINANAGFYRNLGRIGQIGLNYSYARSTGDYSYSSQRISSSLYLRPTDKIGANIYLTKGLGDDSLSAFGDLGYTFAPTWQLQLYSTYQKFDQYTYSDLEVALAKAIGKQEARLIWSQSRQRFRFEFSALSF